MFRKLLLPFTTTAVLGAFALMACEVKVNKTEPQTPPPPPVTAAPVAATPPPPPPRPRIKRIGKANIVGNKIEIPGKILFDLDKATLKAGDTAGLEIISTAAEVMKQNPQITKLEVSGHTDKKGTAAHNKELSEKRAATVVDAMVAKGADKSKLVSAGFGSEKPFSATATDDDNRRVEFKILEIDGKPAPDTLDSAPATAGDAGAPVAADAGKK